MCSNCSDLTGEAAEDMSLAICSQGTFPSMDLCFGIFHLLYSTGSLTQIYLEQIRNIHELKPEKSVQSILP